MKSEIDKIYLIDRFLKGELSGHVLDEFRTKMRIDKDFAIEVESQKALIEGIKLARKQQLISILQGQKIKIIQPTIKEDIKSLPTKENETDTAPIFVKPSKESRIFEIKPNYNNWYWAVAAMLFTLFILYFVFGYYLPRQKGEYANTVDSSNNTTSIEKNQTIGLDNNNDSIDLARNPYTNDSLYKANLDPSNSIVQNDSLPIEKDKKLTERTYSVSGWETINPVGSNSNTNASTGLPDSMGLKNIKRLRRTIISVEFWQSVVNFKGYKLIGSNLQLFDIKSEEGLKLKYLNSELYLKKGGSFYKLRDSGDFETYQKESSIEILKILESL